MDSPLLSQCQLEGWLALSPKPILHKGVMYLCVMKPWPAYVAGGSRGASLHSWYVWDEVKSAWMPEYINDIPEIVCKRHREQE